MDTNNLPPAKRRQIRVDLAAERRAAEPGLTPEEFSAYYPGYEDPVRRDRARRLYLREDRSLAEAASMVGLPLGTITAWAYTERWVERKALETGVLQSEERVALARLRTERRTQIVKDQLDVSKKIRDRADDLLEEADTPSRLKSAAEATKLAADVETRALGIADDGRIDVPQEGEDASGRPGGKQPLVIVFNGPNGLPPVRAAQGGYGEVVDAPVQADAETRHLLSRNGLPGDLDSGRGE